MKKQLNLFGDERGLARKVHVQNVDSEPEIVHVHNGRAYNLDNPTNEESDEQQRIADGIMLQKRVDEYAADYEARQMKQKYKDFLADPRMRYVSLDIYKQPELKMMLLQAYFPGQFSVKKQDLRQRAIPKIGKAFNALVNYARGM